MFWVLSALGSARPLNERHTGIKETNLGIYEQSHTLTKQKPGIYGRSSVIFSSIRQLDEAQLTLPSSISRTTSSLHHTTVMAEDTASTAAAAATTHAHQQAPTPQTTQQQQQENNSNSSSYVYLSNLPVDAYEAAIRHAFAAEGIKVVRALTRQQQRCSLFRCFKPLRHHWAVSFLPTCTHIHMHRPAYSCSRRVPSTGSTTLASVKLGSSLRQMHSAAAIALMASCCVEVVMVVMVVLVV